MSGPVIYFFDIPVYRLCSDDYEKQKRAYVEKTIFSDAMSRDFYERYPDKEIQFRDHLERQYGGIWRFNEIIGFIRLHFLGSQIRGEYFATNAERIVRTRRKVFEYQTHKLAAEIDIPEEASNNQILGLIGEYLNDCQQELRGRYLDRSVFDEIGPYVDWKSLLRKGAT